MISRHLLILPCSKRKKKVENISALELYDGPFYRILKNYNYHKIDIIIISAKYGLIKSNESISYYDQRMTKERAKDIAGETRSRLEVVLSNNKYKSIFINLGKTYMLALDDSQDMLERYNAYYVRGRIGERLHQLKSWLCLIGSEEVLTS